MPRQSTAKTKPGELVSFADLKAKRDIKRAQYACTVYAFDKSEPIKAGDIVLCELKQGGQTLAFVDSAGDDETYTVRANNLSDIKAVIGRVVQSVGVFAND